MDGMITERLGNLHLIFLHLPIGFVVAVVLLECWRWRRPSTEGAWLQGRLLAANAICTLLTAGAGLLLASAGGYAEEVLALHRWAGVACAGAAVAAWAMHLRCGMWPARAALGVLFTVTMIAGHLGATLTHGAGVTGWWGGDRAVPAFAGVKNDVFVTQIQPVLERACIDCHGPEKARGRLRLDDRASALAGGESGVPAIVLGDVAASEMLRRVRLPRYHEDAMPSDDRPRLTESEINALERWITDGARY